MTDDSEWEDPDERENRLYVERYNFDLFEGMAPLTFTPPPQKNRRRRYEVRVKNGPEIQESTGRTSELAFQTDEESPNSELTVQPGRLLMKISPQVGIRKITADAGGGPEVMRTFPGTNVQICLTDRSWSR